MTDPFLSPGSLIQVEYGEEEIIKELVVENLSLDFMDFENDQAGGAADDGKQIQFVLEGPEVYEEGFVTAGEEGWMIDFWMDYEIDLQEDMWLWVSIEDDDGDKTHAELVGEEPPPSAVINAYPQFDLVNGWFWPVGETVTLVVDDDFDPDTGNLFETTGVSQPAPWYPYEPFVSFDLRPFDLQPDHFVIMFAENFDPFQVHQVKNLALLSADHEFDQVSGTADPATDVFVVINWNTEIIVTADGSGNWVADFSGQYDLVYGDMVTAFQPDENWNMTLVEKLIVTPGGLVDEILNMPDDLIAPEIKNSLVKKVENAYSSYIKGNVTAAVNKLEALLNEIDAQLGNKISEDLSHHLHMLVYNLIRNFEE
jgi:hypothetical protein